MDQVKGAKGDLHPEERAEIRILGHKEQNNFIFEVLSWC